MSELVRLRISLSDRPGALAQVATIIAGHGGNITSVDVLRVDAQSVVDDVVVDFATDPDLPTLRADLAASGGARLVSHQETRAVDPIVGSLHRVVELLDSEAPDAGQALAQGVADLCSSPVVWVSSTSEAARYDAGRIALERRGAVALLTTDLPDHLAERLPGEVLLLAVPDPEHTPAGRVVFVARPAANDFTATEIARVEALTAMFTRLDRLLAARDGPARRL